MQFPDASFDAISMFHVLEHLYDPRAVLKESRRILKPTGQLIIAIPNVRSPQRAVFGRFWTYWEAPRHFWHFTPATVTRLLSEAGFHVDRILQQPLLQPQNPLISLRYWLSDVFPQFRKARAMRPASKPMELLFLPLGYLLRLLGGASKMVVFARKNSSH
jgi:ubiquinone/menaquinone biosynthesis C-methylase UbiE